jgi:hypothetical protein
MKNFFGMPPSTSARLGGLLCFTALLLAAGAVHRPASAAIVMTANEIGSDVVFSYTGTLNITGMTSASEMTIPSSRVRASGPIVHFKAAGPSGANSDSYSSPFSSRPSNLGTTSTSVITATTSSATAVFGTTSDTLYLDNRLTASDWLTTQSGSMTFQGKTLAGLGIVPGTYTWVLKNSAADTITLNASQAVPEPSSLMLVGAGGVVCVFVSSRRRLMGKR